jgi:hypothetical protein
MMSGEERGNYISCFHLFVEQQEEDAWRKLRMFAKYYEKDMKLHSNVRERKILDNALKEFSSFFWGQNFYLQKEDFFAAQNKRN